MTTRPLRDSDIPILRAMYEKMGFSYEFPDLCGPLIESVVVVVDAENRPIMAVAAQRLVQLYLFMGDERPSTKLLGIQVLHHVTATELRKKGYNSCEAFIPPSIAAKFGRRLERTFRWVRNWPSWTKSF